MENNIDNEDRLIYYEYTLHHKLRASWARVRGLIHLLNLERLDDEGEKIKQMLTENLEEMDVIMDDVSQKLSTRNNIGAE